LLPAEAAACYQLLPSKGAAKIESSLWHQWQQWRLLPAQACKQLPSTSSNRCGSPGCEWQQWRLLSLSQTCSRLRQQWRRLLLGAAASPAQMHSCSKGRHMRLLA
jgi:hypothetical protein